MSAVDKNPRSSGRGVVNQNSLTVQKPAPAERIYGWLNGHLSIARFYGGITVNGNFYTIAYNEPDSPLVRFDVLKREAKEKRAAKKAEKGTLL